MLASVPLNAQVTFKYREKIYANYIFKSMLLAIKSILQIA